MSKPKISIQNVALSYYSFNQGVNSIKDIFTGFNFSKPFEKHEVLNHVSFDIMPGEVVGVLGKNGVGKSTLLKAIAGMIKPSEGEIEVNGKVAPILAIGAGIEMELTGYENIKLLVSLMGSRIGVLKEVMPKIVGFSELSDEELNRPVKTYSTGMISRLSFSIGVAQDPDILIIDEVLAVGDMGFQQKCMKRIEEIKQNGSTILFVSHNIDEIKMICSKAALLGDHTLIEYGNVNQVSETYLRTFH